MAHLSRSLCEVLPPGVDSWIAHMIRLLTENASPTLPDGWMRISCFGQDLQVHRDTLRRGHPSRFDALDAEPKDSRGTILLDRDGDLVNTMFTFLRYGRLMLRGRHTVEDVLVEARHWGLTNLVQLCEQEIACINSEAPTTTGNDNAAAAAQSSTQSQLFDFSSPLIDLTTGATPPPLDPSLSGRYTPPRAHMNMQSRRFHDAVKNRPCDEPTAAQQTDAVASCSASATVHGAGNRNTLGAEQQYELSKIDFRGGRPIMDAIRRNDGRFKDTPYVNCVPRLPVMKDGQLIYTVRVPPQYDSLGEVHEENQNQAAEDTTN